MEQNRGKRGRPKLPGLNTPEREDRKRAQKRKSDETRVRIGAEADRWLQIKSKYGLRKDVDVAKLLMDRFVYFTISQQYYQINTFACLKIALHADIYTAQGIQEEFMSVPL